MVARIHADILVAAPDPEPRHRPHMPDFTDDLPEVELTEQQMAARYTQAGGWRYDPARQAYAYSYQARVWFATLDNEERGACTIATDEFAVWNVTLWYTKEPGENYRCVGGVRESAGFFLLRHEVCTDRGTLITRRVWTEMLPDRPVVRQRFTYVPEDGGDPDRVWKSATD
jgi:hypothetical protein